MARTSAIPIVTIIAARMERAARARNRGRADLGSIASTPRRGYRPSPMTALERFAALLAPLAPSAFFEQAWEKEPLHLRAEGRRAPLVTHDALLAALRACAEPPEGLVVFPEHFGAIDTKALLRDEALLDAYLASGHPIVWNRARGVAPAIDALAAALAEVFGAHVWPNVYATGHAGTPFDVHFDCHEVIAVHCEGEKEWTISAVRADRPLDAAGMEPAVRAMIEARRDEAAARVALRFSVAPGDVVYIPRGQFHNACTPRGRSLHVTFGIRLLSGHDVIERLGALALADPELREMFPPLAADPSGAGAAARLSDIVTRIAAHLTSDALIEDVVAARALLVRRSAGNPDAAARDGVELRVPER
jgi:hypothetical protein